MLSNNREIRRFFSKFLEPVAEKVNLSPNAITLVGLVVAVVAAVAIPKNLAIGGLLIILSGFFDMLDGAVARIKKKSSKFGAFFDSVVDRYADSIIMLGFLWYFIEKGSDKGIFLTAGVIIGTMAISYVKARAEGLGEKCDTGIMERPERIVLLSVGALFNLATGAMMVMLILTHITVVQRVIYVWKKMNKK